MTDVNSTQAFVVVRDQGPGLDALKGAVVALGNFDGVHLGHRQVIATAQARAATLGALAAVLTFEPHPRIFFKPDEPLFRLTDETNKLRLLAATGLTGAVVMTFDAALASLSAQDFVDRILIDRLAIAGAVVGSNFHFGRQRTGSPDFLIAEGKRRGFAVDIVPVFTHGGRPVSSGPIREALAGGNVGQAADLLGYPWFVAGRVIEGDKRGRELGFPTANLRLDPDCRLRYGIYAVRVGIGDQRYGGVASFGRRPMFATPTPLLEVFLFDFSGDLYGRSIDVAFISWIREEMQFAGIAALIAQMDKDSAQARAMLAAAPDAFPPLGTLVA
ncbi:MAG TPA: bifunctional riboflavin kinase/FAD synthetase [Xanthobacteraceae bacterium]|nr:bifunctional riboflavin kinase/FAD synthetase [Xanthobacteraceae bacterium]